jgi:hypothetical protein
MNEVANKDNSQLTTRQETLLGKLLEGTKWRQALAESGYMESINKSDILRSAPFRKALADNLEGMLAFNGPEALKAIEDVMYDPNEPGSAVKLKAATEFLDRSGLGKLDRSKPEETTVNHVFILPPKEEYIE